MNKYQALYLWFHMYPNNIYPVFVLYQLVVWFWKISSAEKALLYLQSQDFNSSLFTKLVFCVFFLPIDNLRI